MGSTNQKNSILRISFYLLWLTVSLIQAYHTELLADEAYYWKYAQDLQWGYFDHPPVVAAMIKPGYWLLQHEAGVRLLFVLSSTGFLYLLELLVQPKNLLRYYLAVVSIGAFHFLGFLALPDMPLLFFSACFLYLYKRYLVRDGWGVSLLLAANATLLLLSKYHGILLIGFTILSNPSLFKRKTFWLLALLSLNMFIPHIQWQIAHDFPSVKYHLYERAAGAYKIDYTLNYLLSVILIFGPAMGLALAWRAARTKTKWGTFDHTLRVTLIGTLLFFFLMTFKGRAEANWVAPALIPALILGYKTCEDRSWFPKFTRYSFGISIVLILILRLYLVYDFLPDRPQFTYVKNKIHHTQAWAEEIHNKADDRPVTFMNKYQYAALYEFYTGMPAISLNNRMGRKNQYNIWKDEYNILGKEVMMVPNFEAQWMDSFATAKGIFRYQYIHNFRSASGIKIEPEKEEIVTEPLADIEVTFSVSQGEDTYDLEANPDYPPIIHILLFQGDQYISDTKSDTYLFNSMINDGQKYTLSFQAPEKKGRYSMYIDVAMGWLPSAINSKKVTLTVR